MPHGPENNLRQRRPREGRDRSSGGSGRLALATALALGLAIGSLSTLLAVTLALNDPGAGDGVESGVDGGSENAAPVARAASDPAPESGVAQASGPRASETVAAPPAALPAVRSAHVGQEVAAVRPPADDRPMIAVVFDDLGLDRDRSARAVALPPPLTTSFLAYAEELELQAAAARAAGHELMLHLPMEPHSPEEDPGPGALQTDLGEDELRQRVKRALDRFSGYVGVNNHMGSRFTEDRAGMSVVMEELRERGLFFLDSRTTPDTVGTEVARRVGVPVVERTVFLDHDPSREAIREALVELEHLARDAGFAIAIGHPHDTTIEVLAEWLPQVESRGLALVPLSTIVARADDPD
ncbi:MAG: divergent polysaccharide deacetylase family protein [Alphaproteobacteria bacterium]